MTLTQINKAGLDELALDHVFTIGASGSDHYTFQGEGLNGTVNDPTLYLTRGKTYRFENGPGAHPIRIQSTSGASGTAYNTGVTNNAGSGTVIVEVQHDAPDVLYYQCTSHAAMNGILYITGALADGGVTTAKLAADAVDGTKIADNAVAAEHIAANAVGSSELADNAIDTAAIADQAVDLTKLPHGTGSNDGKFLRANNGADPTFETVNTDLVSDTSPQLGGDLQSNGSDIDVADSDRARFGNGGDLDIFHDGTENKLACNSGVNLRVTTDQFIVNNAANNEEMLKAIGNGACELYYNAVKKVETTTDGIEVSGAIFASGKLDVPDNAKLMLGTSDDLQIYHDGTNNYIEGNNQKTIIRNTSNNIHIQAVSGEGGIDVLPNGAVKLYYDNSNKLQTNSQGFALMDDSSTRLSLTYSGGLVFLTANSGHEIKVSSGNGDANGIEFWDYSGVNKRCQIDGHGIKFNSDTAAANALDDYEEGTWTPTGNWTSVVGTYTKIGSVVHAGFAVTSNTSANTGIDIGGLPYNCGNNEASRNGIFFGWNQWDSNSHGMIAGNITPNANNLGIYIMNGSGNQATYSQLGNSKTLKGVICYQVT